MVTGFIGGFEGIEWLVGSMSVVGMGRIDGASGF
jgi:hypothetical protein